VSQPDNHYLVLGLSSSADEDDIKRAYRVRAMRYHPDRVPSERQEWARSKMSRINAAYEVLGDPLKRAQYDQQCGFASICQPQAAPATAFRRHAQREGLRRGQIERQRVVTLSGAAILGIVLVSALVRFRWLGMETTVGRCAWAIVLGVGTLLVLAALRLTEL
jgi:preprotein translocase subunit Sec63